ncbi:hypothetical protein BC829DRAFT_436864 [Chytridium lagenaria]|nr:hypothetical protein BC829DRAFT_436864 [Chytridium lagenaria]
MRSPSSDSSIGSTTSVSSPCPAPRHIKFTPKKNLKTKFVKAVERPSSPFTLLECCTPLSDETPPAYFKIDEFEDCPLLEDETPPAWLIRKLVAEVEQEFPFVFGSDDNVVAAVDEPVSTMGWMDALIAEYDFSLFGYVVEEPKEAENVKKASMIANMSEEIALEINDEKLTAKGHVVEATVGALENASTCLPVKKPLINNASKFTLTATRTLGMLRSEANATASLLDKTSVLDAIIAEYDFNLFNYVGPYRLPQNIVDDVAFVFDVFSKEEAIKFFTDPTNGFNIDIKFWAFLVKTQWCDELEMETPPTAFSRMDKIVDAPVHVKIPKKTSKPVTARKTPSAVPPKKTSKPLPTRKTPAVPPKKTYKPVPSPSSSQTPKAAIPTRPTPLACINKINKTATSPQLPAKRGVNQVRAIMSKPNAV